LVVFNKKSYFDKIKKICTINYLLLCYSINLFFPHDANIHFLFQIKETFRRLGQIAEWTNEKSFASLPRSLKHSRALLGSDPVRDKTAANDDKSCVKRLLAKRRLFLFHGMLDLTHCQEKPTDEPLAVLL
jgi:hypothetical protein